MGFLLECPNCGERDVYDFTYGGEFRSRPPPDASPETWSNYIYLRENTPGPQKEWWFHRLGCEKWFIAIRDSRDNKVLSTFLPEEEQDISEP